MPKFELVKAGDVLWDYRSERAGNTTMRRMGNRRVRIVSIDHERGTARVIWNDFNPEQTYTRQQVERLRRTRGKESGQ